MTAPRSSTETLVAALRVLAAEIQSPDGVANAAIAEAADRLVELDKRNTTLVCEIQNGIDLTAGDSTLMHWRRRVRRLLKEHS